MYVHGIFREMQFFLLFKRVTIYKRGLYEIVQRQTKHAQQNNKLSTWKIVDGTW